MRIRLLILLLASVVLALLSSAHLHAARQEVEDVMADAGGEHLRLETPFGPVHLWRPATYREYTAGMVIYIHGYYTSVDKTWTDDHLAAQFRDSGRNALFITVEAPQSNAEDVYWKSLDDLLGALANLSPFPLPAGPLVVVGHSGAYRTILGWLPNPRLRELILLDAMYGGESEFRYWLRSAPRATPHRMVLVAIDTAKQSNRFARRVPGTARRRGIPAEANSFTARQAQARLLYLRSQYDHAALVSSGRVIPVLLQVSSLRSFEELKAPPTRTGSVRRHRRNGRGATSGVARVSSTRSSVAASSP